MEQDLIQKALEYGLDAAWLLPVFSYSGWLSERTAGKYAPQTEYIRENPDEDLPGCNALLLLLKSYAPLRDELVSGYYFASQKSYESARALIEYFRAEHIPAAMARVPLRIFAAKSGIGYMLKNGLMAIPPYGTRFALQGILLKLKLEETPGLDQPAISGNACLSCGLCEKACPTGSIDKSGFHWQKCLRTYMENEPMPENVMQNIFTLLGCERCQRVCPVNTGVEPRGMTEEERRAFSLERLLAGEQKEALSFIGKNQKKNGKLIAQAACAAANRGREDLVPLLEQLTRQELSTIQKSSVKYALSVLKK